MAAVALPAKIVATAIQGGAVAEGNLLKLALAVEVLELFAVLVVAVTLRGWMGSINQRLALAMLVASSLGAAVGGLADVVLIAGAPMSDDLLTATSLVGSAGLGLWFLIGGTLIGRDESQVPRLGWIGQVAGFGFLVTAVLLVLPAEMQARLADNVVWFVVIGGIFALLYLVRLGRFMAFGHVPTGPV